MVFDLRYFVLQQDDYGHGLNWTIGKHARDPAKAGATYDIMLEADALGAVSKVAWLPVRKGNAKRGDAKVPERPACVAPASVAPASVAPETKAFQRGFLSLAGAQAPLLRTRF